MSKNCGSQLSLFQISSNTLHRIRRAGSTRGRLLFLHCHNQRCGLPRRRDEWRWSQAIRPKKCRKIFLRYRATTSVAKWARPTECRPVSTAPESEAGYIVGTVGNDKFEITAGTSYENTTFHDATVLGHLKSSFRCSWRLFCETSRPEKQAARCSSAGFAER